MISVYLIIFLFLNLHVTVYASRPFSPLLLFISLLYTFYCFLLYLRVLRCKPGHVFVFVGRLSLCHVTFNIRVTISGSPGYLRFAIPRFLENT
jgi:hypothetical protein